MSGGRRWDIWCWVKICVTPKSGVEAMLGHRIGLSSQELVGSFLFVFFL